MADVEKAHELFEREASALKALSHPGVPKFYDYFIETNKKYLVMEIVFGENLQSLQAKRGSFDARDVVIWMVEVCEILKHIHEKGVIHRDVKPANLMLRHRPRGIVLIDFGAVKEIGTRPGTVIGSGCFSAPEQRRGKPTPQSDVYSLGVTLLALLTGMAPEPLYDAKEDRFRALDRYLDPFVQEIVERATYHDPARRYADVENLRQDLLALSP